MNNNRRNFIKLTSLAGTASLLPLGNVLAKSKNTSKTEGSCVLIPSETSGPFPLDLTTNTAFFRKDVRENKLGVQLNLKLKILGLENCEPMQNLRVNIWHCDKDGLYSGYSQTNNEGQAGLTYLRGYQITDAFGEVEFITILPGWYNGRTCHIHFQVFVSSSYAAISQLTFDMQTKNSIYSANPTLYTKGVDPLAPINDNIFSDGYSYQLATLTPNSMTGGYDSFLEVTVQGNGKLGVGNEEKETEKQFTLGQNFPNPYLTETTIPFTLTQPSDISIELWDLLGKKITKITKTGLNAGDQLIKLNLKDLGLVNSSCVYQLEVSNSQGTFKQCKLMTFGE
ncbi:MAG: T9SS type A sorting domain-containing protein [Bacteroidetes bacterium]|nr:T9SS type A sorting domain-containing protein [Bacteroidota bacterium]